MVAEVGEHQYAFFTQDLSGCWHFGGIHHDQEVGLRLVEKYKHDPHCQGIVAAELPKCRIIYEWSKERT